MRIKLVLNAEYRRRKNIKDKSPQQEHYEQLNTVNILCKRHNRFDQLPTIS